MIIGGIIAICIVLAILAFLVPRLSRGPQHGVDRTLGVGQSAGANAAGYTSARSSFAASVWSKFGNQLLAWWNSPC